MYLTEKLYLRPFIDKDKDKYSSINADPDVMRYYPKILNKKESNISVEKYVNKWKENGIAFAAIILRETNQIVGMVGIQFISFSDLESLKWVGGCNVKNLQGSLEIGWRLEKKYWGKGLVTEACRVWLNHGLEVIKSKKYMPFL